MEKQSELEEGKTWQSEIEIENKVNGICFTWVILVFKIFTVLLVAIRMLGFSLLLHLFIRYVISPFIMTLVSIGKAFLICIF